MAPTGRWATWRLGRELLAPTLVPRLMPEATRPIFPGLAGVLPGFGRQDPNDWGLGFELRDGKRPHWTGAHNSPGTFGHFGQSGSFLWVDPALGLACAGLAGQSFGEWAVQAWPALSDAVIAELAIGERRPRRSGTAGRNCGAHAVARGRCLRIVRRRYRRARRRPPDPGRRRAASPGYGVAGGG